jgi:superoxide dismutase, Cu-Zn family
MNRAIRMNRMIRWTMLAGLAAAGAIGGGLSLAGGAASGEGGSAVAVLHPTGNSSVSGVVRFARTDGGIKITATVKGLAPGKHGFHIHELGDCSAADATSAGGHYNPDGHPHAGPDKAQRHMGDMGNLEADSSGSARYERLDNYMKLDGAKSIIGRAVIVHAGQDDLTTQPTGNAGGRLACGVIGISR